MPLNLKKVLNYIDNDAEEADFKKIMDALKAKGVSTRKPRAKKVNVKTDFNPDKCHARCFDCSDPDKFGGKTGEIRDGVHVGLKDFQCTWKKTDGDYCNRHAGEKHRCTESGELYMGDFNEDRPKAPTRVSKKGNTHKYIWLEDMDGDFDEFLAKVDKKTEKKAEKK